MSLVSNSFGNSFFNRLPDEVITDKVLGFLGDFTKPVTKSLLEDFTLLSRICKAWQKNPSISFRYETARALHRLHIQVLLYPPHVRSFFKNLGYPLESLPTISLANIGEKKEFPFSAFSLDPLDLLTLSDMQTPISRFTGYGGEPGVAICVQNRHFNIESLINILSTLAKRFFKSNDLQSLIPTGSQIYFRVFHEEREFDPILPHTIETPPWASALLPFPTTDRKNAVICVYSAKTVRDMSDLVLTQILKGTHPTLQLPKPKEKLLSPKTVLIIHTIALALITMQLIQLFEKNEQTDN